MFFFFFNSIDEFHHLNNIIYLTKLSSVWNGSLAKTWQTVATWNLTNGCYIGPGEGLLKQTWWTVVTTNLANGCYIKSGERFLHQTLRTFSTSNLANGFYIKTGGFQSARATMNNRMRFKNAVTSKLEYSSANEAMTAYLLTFPVSPDFDMFIYNKKPL